MLRSYLSEQSYQTINNVQPPNPWPQLSAVMDESSQSQNGQIGPHSGPMGVGPKQTHEEHNQRTQYSMPGILHFIQHEWARFEMEKAQWEVERAELQVSLIGGTGSFSLITQYAFGVHFLYSLIIHFCRRE